MGDCYENRLRQTWWRGNPRGCPFPAPTRFHPLMWPLQGHSDSERSEESKVHNRKTGQPGPLSHQWRVADSQIRTPFSRSWESACPVLNPAVGARVNAYSCQPPPGERYREGVFAIQLTKTEQLPFPLTFESQEPLSYTTHVGTRHQAPSARHVKRHKTL